MPRCFAIMVYNVLLSFLEGFKFRHTSSIFYIFTNDSMTLGFATEVCQLPQEALMAHVKKVYNAY